MLGIACSLHHVLLLLLVFLRLETAPRTLPICHLANLPFVICLASNKYSRAATSSDGSCIRGFWITSDGHIVGRYGNGSTREVIPFVAVGLVVYISFLAAGGRPDRHRSRT